MKTSDFLFKPLAMTDLDLLCDWFEEPHVWEWWRDSLTREQVKDKYARRINDPVVCPFIVYLVNKPVGFIQYYWVSQVGDGWWPKMDDTTVGADQFIGDISYINQGQGTLMMKSFVDFLFRNPKINRIITDVDPANYRARRCYVKAGFRESETVNTPEGVSIVMVINRQK